MTEILLTVIIILLIINIVIALTKNNRLQTERPGRAGKKYPRTA